MQSTTDCMYIHKKQHFSHGNTAEFLYSSSQ